MEIKCTKTEKEQILYAFANDDNAFCPFIKCEISDCDEDCLIVASNLNNT